MTRGLGVGIGSGPLTRTTTRTASRTASRTATGVVVVRRRGLRATAVEVRRDGPRAVVLVREVELWLDQESVRRTAPARAAHALDQRRADVRGLGQCVECLHDPALVLAGPSCELDQRRAAPKRWSRRVAVEREQRQLDRAEEWFSHAASIADNSHDLLLAAETAREQAELYWIQARNSDTLQALNAAHGWFSQLRAERDLDAIERRNGRLEERFLEVVRKWGESIESKDCYTQGHCVRVADLACTLAQRIGFDERTLFWFRIGALLHDVGKIVVPIEILNKPGRFTPEEREIMERHAAAGAELLADIDFPWDILPMVRGHHERWDGRGYPDKLAGENIAPSARMSPLRDAAKNASASSIPRCFST